MTRGRAATSQARFLKLTSGSHGRFIIRWARILTGFRDAKRLPAEEQAKLMVNYVQQSNSRRHVKNLA